MGIESLLQWGRQKDSKNKTPTTPKVPNGTRLYVIGDIHGRYDLLTDVHEKIANDAGEDAENIEIYLGDYIDRGPESAAVIDLLARSKTANTTRIFLKGNHEETLLNFLSDPLVLSGWRQYGGLETLHSYGVNAANARDENGFEQVRQQFAASFPQAHLTFFQSLRPYTEIGDYFFVHAGIKPGVPLHLQTEHDLLWIRDEFLHSRADHGKMIVHGHTPVDGPEVWPNRINVDTGAYLTNRLTCLVLEGETRRLI